MKKNFPQLETLREVFLGKMSKQNGKNTGQILLPHVKYSAVVIEKLVIFGGRPWQI
jgi:hypothetical protein